MFQLVLITWPDQESCDTLFDRVGAATHIRTDRGGALRACFREHDSVALDTPGLNICAGDEGENVCGGVQRRELLNRGGAPEHHSIGNTTLACQHFQRVSLIAVTDDDVDEPRVVIAQAPNGPDNR